MKVEGEHFAFEVTSDGTYWHVVGHCIDVHGNEIELDSDWCGIDLYSFEEADRAITTTILEGNHESEHRGDSQRVC